MTPEWRQWRRSFVFMFNFEYISQYYFTINTNILQYYFSIISVVDHFEQGNVHLVFLEVLLRYRQHVNLAYTLDKY